MTEVDFTPSDPAKVAQCTVLLNHLTKYGSITTITARETYGIAHPGGRVHDLRWLYGCAIHTVKAVAYDAQGRPHKCACYVMGVSENA